MGSRSIIRPTLVAAMIVSAIGSSAFADDGPIKGAGPAEGGTNTSSSPEPGVNVPDTGLPKAGSRSMSTHQKTKGPHRKA